MIRAISTPRAAAAILAACLPFTAALSDAAAAAPYNTVVPEASHVNFHYQQMGVTMDGEFARFNGELYFDPEQPDAATAAFDVDLSSVDTGTADGDTEVAGKDWFHTEAHPVARFESTAVRALDADHYEVSGTLTIKGQSRPVVIPATFTTEEDKGIFEGRFSIKRGDFNVGEGTWSGFDIVANNVDVSFRIAATAD